MGNDSSLYEKECFEVIEGLCCQGLGRRVRCRRVGRDNFSVRDSREVGERLFHNYADG